MAASQRPANPAERLQKVLAGAGFGSRRQCEELILEGRVDVDREVVTALGSRVNPETQAIRVDGIPIRKQRLSYFAVHKPAGVLSTSKDQWGRARVIDLVDAQERLFTIGRLDKESSGLILVTNDGELANQLTHPRYRVPKTYRVTVAGAPSQDVLHKLRRGLVLSDGPVKPQSVTIKKRLKQATILEVVLTEGRNREIRRMLARFDHKVLKLHRIAFGPLRLADLPSGAHRPLTRDEIRRLRAMDPSPVQKKVRRKKSSARIPKGGVPPKKEKAPTVRMGAVIGGRSSGSLTGRKPSSRTARKKSVGKRRSR